MKSLLSGLFSQLHLSAIPIGKIACDWRKTMPVLDFHSAFLP